MLTKGIAIQPDLGIMPWLRMYILRVIVLENHSMTRNVPL